MEINLAETTVPPERSKVLKQLPSPPVLYQETSKLVHEPANLKLQDVSDRLGLSVGKKAIDKIRLMYPDVKFDHCSNLSKARLARIAVMHELLFGSGNPPPTSISEKAIDLSITEYSMRDEVHAKVKLAKEEFMPETALKKDLDYIRANGGGAFESRVLDGRLSREQAIAITSVFESGDFQLTSLEKTQILNHISKNPDSSVINFIGSSGSLTQEQIKKVMLEIKLRTRVLNNILNFSFSKGENRDGIPLSSFSGVIDRCMYEFRECQNNDGLRVLVKEIVAKDHLPEKITRLTDIPEILKNHPEIKAVSFDLYNTLVGWSSTQGERKGRMNTVSANSLREKFGLNITEEKFRKISDAAWAKRWRNFQSKGVEVKIDETLGWMADDVLRDLSITNGKNLSGLRQELVNNLRGNWYKVELETAIAIPGAVDTLRQLKALGIKVCLTSNASWSGEHVRRVLNRFDLLPYFDAISYSAEHGKMKHPNVGDFFHHSWEKLKVNSSQVLHVGDNVVDDIQGATNAGAKAILYKNPTSMISEERKPSENYHQKALEAHTRAQNQEAISRIENMMEMYNVPLVERERLRIMAREVYQKTRDVVAPSHIALSEVLLQRLAKKETDLVLCLARDGLPFAVVQKQLLFLEPERYKGVNKDQIKYMYISRRFIDQISSDPDFRQKYAAYVKQLGVDKAKKITITDLFCGSGKTHRGIRDLFKDKQIEGYYTDSAQIGKKDIANHSFLKESTGDYAAGLSNLNMLLLFETLFSGPFESSQDMLPDKQGRISPKMIRKNPAPEALSRGLSKESLLVLNYVAVRGMVDAVETTHRKRMLGFSDPSSKKIMEKFYTFISATPTDAWKDIWRSIPWQDYGIWKLASQNEIEQGWLSGKIK